MDRAKINEVFSEYYPYTSKTPHYRTVKSKHPYLFNLIMKQFGGYRAFCRATNRKYPKTSAREAAFIKLSSAASRRWHYNNWSSLEEITWAILESFNVADEYIHNCPFPSPKGRWYKLDFFNPFTMKVIEVDGPFHRIQTNKKLDQLKDKWLASFGITVLRLTLKDFKNWNIIIDKLLYLIQPSNTSIELYNFLTNSGNLTFPK